MAKNEKIKRAVAIIEEEKELSHEKLAFQREHRNDTRAQNYEIIAREAETAVLAKVLARILQEGLLS